MKRNFFTTALLVCCVVVCLAAITDITGNWSATLKPGDGSSIKVIYTFKTDGDNFTGNVAFPGSNFPITDGDSISFMVTLNGKGIPNYGKVYTDSIGLDIVLNGMRHHNTLTRAE